MTKRQPLIGPDGEVRELDEDFFRKTKRGRPPLPKDERKKRVQLLLDPEVVQRLKAKGNMSGTANDLLRDALDL